MEHKKIDLFSILIILILMQPFFDILIYFVNNVQKLDIYFLSFIRPLISIITYIILLFSYRVSKQVKKFSFIYLIIYALFCLIHLINIRNNYFDLSYGTIGNEIRFLCNFGYFILQFINFNIIFKLIDKGQKKRLLLSITYAVLIMVSLYFISIITQTSPRTYTYSIGKEGWKGWSVSAHYIGHVIMYSLPIVIYTLFENKYVSKIKYLMLVLIIIPAYYLVGTKTPFFAVLIIVIFYTMMKIVDSIKNKKIDVDTIFFVGVSLTMLFTIKLTFGYDNFLNQLNIVSSDGESKIDLIETNLDEGKLKKYSETGNSKNDFDNFEDRMLFTIYKYRDIKSSVFDNRTIQKIINKSLRDISPLSDKLVGYGHSNMPNCTWVETDFLTIYYCYGLIGFLLIVVIPFGIVSAKGLICLMNIKKMTRVKFLFGSGFAITLFALYFVGYTMQFAQTVFYMIILISLARTIFEDKTIANKEKRDYLFAINDLNIGGAEVGMIDVVNELVMQGKTVDIVLLRKRGPLIDKVDSKVNIYEIINEDYSNFKRNVYYYLYMLGGPFIKYVYKKTILEEYNNEVAYLEGYPAVFIAASNNANSNKIASIRVGLKNHKLKASKLPWGEYEVKKAYKKMDNIYTVSNLTTEEFLNKYPFCKNKTTTIFTYFNVNDIRKKADTEMNYKYDADKINFLAVGRFSEQKSYDRLVKAFSSVARKHDNVLLHFVGNYETECGEKIRELIKEENLENKIILHGVKSNPYPYIKNCDVLISSSLYEGFPRVVNEAICIGKLCIGTNVTGTNEALRNGELGLLVDDSVDGLVDGMERYIENPSIYLKYKEEISRFDGNKKSYFDGLENISRKKKNMLIYMPKLSYGGMEKSLVNLINYAKLNDKYYLTLYLVYKGDMNYLNLLPNNINLTIACPGKWNLFGKFIALIKLMFRYIYHIFNKFDIAISYSYQHPILNSLTIFSSLNNIVYIHGNLIDGLEQKKIDKKVKICKYSKFNKIICVSNDSKKALVKLINKEENIFVVNNIIDGNRIVEKSNEAINDFNFKSDKIYFINVARHYEKYKKIVRIIQATQRLNDEDYNNFEVLLIGDGENHKLYEQKVKELNISNIFLLGKKENPYKYMKHSSAFVLSSSREGYPVVYIESMILNIPIITTNVSDSKKDIDKKYGIVVDNNDDAIYFGMKKFLDEGYTIKEQFNYKKYNDEIIIELEKIYNEKI